MKRNLWLIILLTSTLCTHANNKINKKEFSSSPTMNAPINPKTFAPGDVSGVMFTAENTAEKPEFIAKPLQGIGSRYGYRLSPEAKNPLEKWNKSGEKLPGSQQALHEFRKGQQLLYKKAAYKQAEAALLRAEVLFRSLNKHKKLFALYHHLANLYARTGQGIKHQEVLAKQTASLQKNFLTQLTHKTAALNKAYSAENQTNQIESLKSGMNRQKNLFYLTSLLVILTTGTCLALAGHYRRYRQKGKLLLAHHKALVRVEGTPIPLQVKKDAGGQPEDIGRHFFQNLFSQTEKHILSKKRHLDPSVKLADIAFELGVNEKYISQAIATGSGKNYREYLANLRIQEARDLLSSSSSITIKEVAWQSGFGNQPQFQRKFKEMTGMTPQTWKKMMHS